MSIDVFAEVRDRVNLADAFAHYGLYPNRSGFVRCPLHGEKTPSLRVFPDGWKCFGCGVGGDAVKFVSLMDGIKPIDAARKLDAVYGLNLFPDKPLTDSERRRIKAAAEQRKRDELLVADFERQYSEVMRFLADFCRIADRHGTFFSDWYYRADNFFFALLEARTVTERVRALLSAKKMIAALLAQNGYGMGGFL